MSDVEDNPFPDLEGEFDADEKPSDVLESPTSSARFQEAIGESQLRKNYWRISFRRVQYGIYQGQPACLIVLEGKFHAEDRKRHRFTWAKIGVSFSGDGSNEALEIKEIVPQRAYGITVPELKSSSWTLKSKFSISMAGIPVSFDVLDVSRKMKTEHLVDRVAGMQGSTRGFPVANQAVWTIEEANSEGIPWRLPSLVILLQYPAGSRFKASFTIDAKVGFSVNPARWPIFATALKPVEFNENKQLVERGKELNSDFTELDLESLTTLNFSGDR